jgi:hypothetical protein
LIIVKGLEIEPISPPMSPKHLPITWPNTKEEFQQKYTSALTIITNCLDNSQVSHISSCNTFKKARDELFLIVWSTRLCDQNVFYGMGNIFKDEGKQIIMKHMHNFKSFLNCCL